MEWNRNGRALCTRTNIVRKNIFQIPKYSLISFTKMLSLRALRTQIQIIAIFHFHLDIPHKFWLKLEFRFVGCRRGLVIIWKYVFKTWAHVSERVVRFDFSLFSSSSLPLFCSYIWFGEFRNRIRMVNWKISYRFWCQKMATYIATYWLWECFFFGSFYFEYITMLL